MTIKGGAYKLIAVSLPDKYFTLQSEIEEPEKRYPKAPAKALFSSFFSELLACIGVGVFFLYWFASVTTPITTITPNIIPGEKCIALNPKKGTVYFNKTTSENGQFASLSSTSNECIALLQDKAVCADGNRNDIVRVWGPANPGNIKFYKSGYLAFTGSLSGGSPITASFPSISFPKPAFGGETVGGSTSVSHPDLSGSVAMVHAYYYSPNGPALPASNAFASLTASDPAYMFIDSTTNIGYVIQSTQWTDSQPNYDYKL